MTNPISEIVEGLSGLIERLKAYRSDWHARMGDVSVLDEAIAALTAIKEDTPNAQ